MSRSEPTPWEQLVMLLSTFALTGVLSVIFMLVVLALAF
jgi:hypothetical protein